MGTLKKVEIGPNKWNKHLTLIPTDESKDTLKQYGELWSEIRDLIRSKANNSESCYEKYIKI